MPEADDEDGELHGPSGNHEIEADRGPAVRLQENHEEAEADENHDMHVLENGVVLRHFRLSFVVGASSRDSTRVHTVAVLCASQVQDDHDDLRDDVH